MACEFVLGSSAVVFLRLLFGSQLAQSKTRGGPWSRMASKASSRKGSEELVGQELARSLWAQGLSEAEAGHDVFFVPQHAEGKGFGREAEGCAQVLM